MSLETIFQGDFEWFNSDLVVLQGIAFIMLCFNMVTIIVLH